MTKALEKWTWATFEPVDNPGRCDYYGCIDSYETTEPCIPPNTGSAYQPYPYGAPSDALVRDLRGLPNEWKYYQLKGSQVDYGTVDRPTLLGNRVLEANVYKGTSSCISCHRRVRAKSDGVPAEDSGYLPDSSSGPTGTPDFTQPIYSPCRPMGFIWSVRLAQPARPKASGATATGGANGQSAAPPAAPCDVE
jgi:hypothetical protein